MSGRPRPRLLPRPRPPPPRAAPPGTGPPPAPAAEPPEACPDEPAPQQEAGPPGPQGHARTRQRPAPHGRRGGPPPDPARRGAHLARGRRATPRDGRPHRGRATRPGPAACGRVHSASSRAGRSGPGCCAGDCLASGPGSGSGCAGRSRPGVCLAGCSGPVAARCVLAGLAACCAVDRRCSVSAVSAGPAIADVGSRRSGAVGHAAHRRSSGRPGLATRHPVGRCTSGCSGPTARRRWHGRPFSGDAVPLRNPARPAGHHRHTCRVGGSGVGTPAGHAARVRRPGRPRLEARAGPAARQPIPGNARAGARRARCCGHAPRRPVGRNARVGVRLLGGPGALAGHTAVQQAGRNADACVHRPDGPSLGLAAHGGTSGSRSVGCRVSAHGGTAGSCDAHRPGGARHVCARDTGGSS